MWAALQLKAEINTFSFISNFSTSLTRNRKAAKKAASPPIFAKRDSTERQFFILLYYGRHPAILNTALTQLASKTLLTRSVHHCYKSTLFHSDLFNLTYLHLRFFEKYFTHYHRSQSFFAKSNIYEESTCKCALALAKDCLILIILLLTCNIKKMHELPAFTSIYRGYYWGIKTVDGAAKL